MAASYFSMVHSEGHLAVQPTRWRSEALQCAAADGLNMTR